MARAALLGRLTWRVASVLDVRTETSSARTLVLSVPDWPGHLAGQHVDVRLTAADGYSAVRSYSVASAPDGERVELTVQAVPDGEVSPYLTGAVTAGDRLELRGPVGGWFVWRPTQSEPVQLVAGGSGVVPLRAMLRARADVAATSPMRLLYSVRDPDSVLYADELSGLAAADRGSSVRLAYTRRGPATAGGAPPRVGRVGADLLADATIPAPDRPTCYVCGPTGFVETVADLLARLGHDAGDIRTERFGPSGGPP
jgi:ferredoxin-NADP reductase